jgi:hypothetical protein
MSLEAAGTEMAKAAVDVTQTGLKLVDSAVKKAWSVMDAASEKRAPSEYLSQQAISAMQGNAPRA